MSVTKTEINTTEEVQAEDYYYKAEFQEKIIENGNDWLDHQSSESLYYNIFGYDQLVLDQTSGSNHYIYAENGDLQHVTGRVQKLYVENQTADGTDYTTQHEHLQGIFSGAHTMFKSGHNIFFNDVHMVDQYREFTNKTVHMTLYHQNSEGENTLFGLSIVEITSLTYDLLPLDRSNFVSSALQVPIASPRPRIPRRVRGRWCRSGPSSEQAGSCRTGPARS